MFNADAKTLIRLRPHLERVLLIDPYPASMKILFELMKNMGASDVQTASRSSNGFELAEVFNPQLIITELTAPHVDAPLFTRRMRRSDFACRKAPVIVLTAEPTAEKIKAARDSGAHEFLRKPFTAGDLFKRVANVSLNARPWVEAVMYVGPDRRRFNSGEYSGPMKRRSDSGTGAAPGYVDRIAQALKILRSALLQAHRDPVQAKRAIQTQIEELTAVALHARDPRLVHAVAALDRYVGSLESVTGARQLGDDFAALTDAAATAGEALDAKKRA